MQKVATKHILLLAGLAGSLFATSANALQVTIGLQEASMNGGALTAVASGDPQTGYVGGYGAFSVNLVNANGIGSGNFPAGEILDSNTLNTSGSAGTLYIYITEQGLTTANGQYNFSSGLANQFLGNQPGSTVEEQVWIDPNDGLFALTDQLAGSLFNGNQTATQNALVAADSAKTYSVTELYIISFTGQNSSSSHIKLQASCQSCGVPGDTPLPAALPLFGSVLGSGGLFFAARRRRLAKAAKPS
jgi:hypothetical protein